MRQEIEIEFPDSSKHKFESGVTGRKIAEQIGQRLAQAALAVKVDSELYDLDRPIAHSAKIAIITFESAEGKEIFWHSSSHLLAQAVKQVFPDVKLGIGPAVDEGFYYDFDCEKPFTPDDLKLIEVQMEKNVTADQKFSRSEITKSAALNKFVHEPLKIELIKEIEDSVLTIYRHGDFEDFCRGPHVPSTKYLKAVKLLKVAGAYWKGNSGNKQLQRIYGISFPDRKDLKQYLTIREEAEKRDHRKIGRQMDLFSIHDEGPGFPFFHNNGMIIYNELVNHMTNRMRRLKYELIKTPLILNKALWLQSGHWDHYKENMYFTKIDGADYAVKPMNCPGGMLVYKSRVHSYRELPIKAGEFGIVHRHELSGVLSGLFRVRVFTQDDAHVFCTPEQLEQQIVELINLVDETYKLFGFTYRVELSTRPEKAMGDPKLWEVAEVALANAMKAKGAEYKINPGDGAFYGPKLDFKIKDAIGREWQCGTIQVDFQMPERFDLTYVGEDNTKHRPVMLHRAIYGSVERFLGVLIEHFAGKFPLWLSPIQVRAITVADRFNDYAEKIVAELLDEGFRAEFDLRTESVSKKVREAQMDKVTLILTIGDKELLDNTVSVRTLDGKVKFGMKLNELISLMHASVKDKRIQIEM